MFGFIQAYVLLAVFRERDTVAGFDAIDVVTFTFVAQGMLAVVEAFGALELADRIASGDVVSDLYRPYDLQAWWLAQDLGRAGFQVLFRCTVPSPSGRWSSTCACPPTPACGPRSPSRCSWPCASASPGGTSSP